MEALCEYVIGWDSICKVVDKEKLTEFGEVFDEIRVALKLEGTDLDIDDVFIYWEDDDYCDVKNELKSLGNKMNVLLQKYDNIKKDFFDKTNVHFSLQLVYDNFRAEYDKEDCYCFVLHWQHIVQYTPSAERMKEMGIDFYLSKWVDDTY